MKTMPKTLASAILITFAALLAQPAVQATDEGAAPSSTAAMVPLAATLPLATSMSAAAGHTERQEHAATAPAQAPTKAERTCERIDRIGKFVITRCE